MLYVIAPTATKASSVTVEIRDKRLTVSVSKTTLDLLLSGDLAFPILTNVEDEAESSAVAVFTPDWEIIDFTGDPQSRRLICVQLMKRAPHEKIVIWWNRILVGEPAIDISNLEDRKAKSSSAATSEPYDIQKTWSTAHQQVFDFHCCATISFFVHDHASFWKR